jgi:hypothetical protein
MLIVEDNDKNHPLEPGNCNYFATTLPELFAAMCSERKIERVSSGFRRLDSFS